MKVCIIGWYGTETIGDRAILAGTLALLSEGFDNVEVSLGSLYPFFSKRTVREDASLWKELTDQDICVELFDSTNVKELKQAILKSDLLLIGGGPFMDLREMHMLAFAFRYARRQGVRCGVFGCGVGPLRKKVYWRALEDILNAADFVVFRDQLSLSLLEDAGVTKKDHYRSAIDPAAYCAWLYRQKHKSMESVRRIPINFRALSSDYMPTDSTQEFEAFACQLVRQLADAHDDHEIVLMPNHYFSIGGDDRVFLNTIKFRVNADNVRVQNSPLSLKATMNVFASSAACIGMRFHAGLLMSLLCGRCRFVNYTGATGGKIRGYLQAIDPAGFFDAKRVLSLGGGDKKSFSVDHLLADEQFVVEERRLLSKIETYRQVLAPHF